MSHVNQDGHTALDVCGCGRLHLTYGAITLNFRREEFLRFAREVERLADYLAGLQRTARPSPQATTKCH
jgi:hypothetical protein